MRDNRQTVGLILTTLCLSQSVAAAVTDPVVVVVQNRSSTWAIVTRSPDSGGVRFAGGELRRYIREMSGADLRAAADAATDPVIVIGLRDELSTEDRAVLPPSAPGCDGYAIAVLAAKAGRPARIVIGGDNGRGAIYGVYDLLERFGCRFFYPTLDPADPEVVPVLDTLALAPAAWAVASPVRYRIANASGWFFDISPPEATRQLEWAMKARYNVMGWQSESKTPLIDQYNSMVNSGMIAALDEREMLLHGPAHSFDHFLKAEAHMAQHPEWFGLRGGKRVPQTFFGAQFCWSNAEARNVFTNNVEAFVEACPAIDILCIVPFDGGQCCECPECTRLGASNALMLLMREVIDRLAVTAPGVLVETVGGYNPMTEPPEGVEIHPKQRIVWAHWGRYHDMGYDDDRYGRKANLETWRKAARGGLTICQYYTDNFAEPWILPPFAIAIESDRRYVINKRIDAVYVLMYPFGYWWNHGLNGYLAGRCYYDESADPFAGIHDYTVHYFGPKAGPLLGKYYEQWAREIDLAYRVKNDALDSHRAMLAAHRREWIDPAAAVVKDDRVLSHRVGKVEKLHTLAERLAELHRRRQEIQSLRKAGHRAEAAIELDRAREYADEVLDLFTRLADLDQGLIERKEVPGFITLGVKNWIEEEARAISQPAP